VSAQGLVTELVEALRGQVLACRCRGTGVYLTDCTLCGDSTEDHECNDREKACERPACVAARNALDRATPEAVRMADAAPEMYEALGKATDKLGRCSNDVLNPCWADRPNDVPGKHWGGGEACAFCTAAAVFEQTERAIAKAEGKP
jgi:hypothetical protein